MLNHDKLFSLLTLAAILLLPAASSADAVPDAPSAPVTEEMILFQEIPSVYGASKYDQKLTEAPSSVSIVTAAEIKNFGYRTLADILKSVRGFYVTNDRNYSYVGVRGFGRPGDYNSRILLLVDGHRLNDSVFDQALVGTEGPIDLDIIDRIEIIRGPGSSLYGNNAFFAVVNIITKRGRDLKGAEVAGEAGSFRTYKGGLSYGDKFENGLEAIVSGSGYDSKGGRLYFKEFDSPATNNGVTEHTDYDRYSNFFTKLSFQDLILSGAYNSRTKGIPTGAFGTDFNDPGNKTTDDHGYLDLKYEHSVARRTDLSISLYYDYFKYYGDYITTGVLNKDSAYGSSLGADVKLTAKPNDANRFIVGAEYQDIMHQDQKAYDVDPYYQYLDDKRKSAIWAAYVQDEISISKVLSLTAGVRYDDYQTFGGSTNPRFALIFNPLEGSTFKLLYGSAFRAPNVFELYYQSNSSLSNPDLKPERIKTYEAVYEQYFGAHLRATVEGYYYKIDNLINQTEASPGFSVFENLARVEARGVELEMENKWGNGVDGRISYTGQRTTDMSTGDVITNSPEQMAKLNLLVPMLKDRLTAGVEEQYMSRRTTLAGNYAPEFFVTNLTLFSPRVLNRLDLSISVYNLLDKKYGDPVSADFTQDTIQQDGRTFRVKLTSVF